MIHTRTARAALSVLLFAAAPLAFAADGDMSVATFLQKANALKAKGAMALFSSDIKVLQREGKGGAMAYRARLAAEIKAGRAPSSCPPPVGKSSISSDELLAHMASYPVAERGRISVTQAMEDIFRKKYPCPK